MEKERGGKEVKIWRREGEEEQISHRLPLEDFEN